MGVWQKVRMGEFLHLYRNEYIVQDDENYRQVTISKNHGISFRGSKAGKNIGRKRQFIIDLKTHPNTVLFTRQGIRDGAIGIAPAEVDGCIVTENMPMMSVDSNLIEVRYLRKLLLSEYLFDKIRLLSVTGSAQKSIHERDLLKIEIELPSLEKQRDECRRFNSLDIEHSELKTELTHQQTLLKKLRQQVLQEAIEGKLTADWRADNPNVENASELLARIKKEKEQLIKDKKIKKQKPLPPISEDEKPFALPDGWVWCRYGDVMLDIEAGKSPTCYNYPARLSEWGVLKISAISWDSFREEENKKLKPNIEPFADKEVKSGDFIMTRANTKELVAKSVIVGDIRQKLLLNDKTLRVSFSEGISLKYMNLFNNGEYARKHYISVATGASPSMKNISRDNIKILPVPLPPLTEQQHIISKVERLFAICEQLKAQITSNQTHAEQLMQAVLKEAFQQSGCEAELECSNEI